VLLLGTEADDLVVQRALQDGSLHKALLDQLEEGIYIVDRSRRILYWNAGAERISGYASHEIAKRFCHGDLLMHCDAEGKTMCGDGCPLTGVMQDGGTRACTIFLRHRDGHRVPVHVRSRAIYDPSREIIGAVEVFEQACAQDRNGLRALQPFGCIDELTGAANRRYGEMRLRQAFEALKEFEIPFGWLRIGIDKTEEYDSRYGQGMVEAALQITAATLNRNLGPLDVLTRWSRDEFRIEANHCSRVELAETAEKLVRLTRMSALDWSGDRLRMTVSVAAVMAERGDTPELLEARVGEVFESCRAGGGNRAAIAHSRYGRSLSCLP